MTNSAICQKQRVENLFPQIVRKVTQRKSLSTDIVPLKNSFCGQKRFISRIELSKTKTALAVGQLQSGNRSVTYVPKCV